jgi:hypothetical protein
LPCSGSNSHDPTGECLVAWLTGRHGGRIRPARYDGGGVRGGVPTNQAHPDADPTAALPHGKQSTRVAEVLDRFPGGHAHSAIVVFERADAILIEAGRDAVENHPGSDRPAGTRRRGHTRAHADDARAALLVIPFDAGLDDRTVTPPSTGFARCSAATQPGRPAG